MRRELTSKTLALIAVAAAVASSVFNWGWASRWSARVENYHREVASVEEKQVDLEHNMVNMAALVMKTSEQAPESARPVPTDPLFARQCADVASSLTLLPTFEAARANAFLVWYHLQMLKRHSEGTPPGVERGEEQR